VLHQVGVSFEMKDLLQGEDIVKHTKSHLLIWHGHVEGMLNQRKP
jgi:hypothetical protein